MSVDPVILVDAYAQIYRGFYAIRHLSNSNGDPTNAVFALAKFLAKLEEDHPSPLGAFVFDLGKPRFRLEVAPDYKANRPPMPDDMKRQLPSVRDWIQASGWPILEAEGHEADDLIAALTTAFPDHPFLVVSGDKDIAQIIDERVRMLVPDRKGGGTKIQGVEEVVSRFGVRPEQIVDYLALIGDSSDNIPGVPGVGPKTAAKLLVEHGSIQMILNDPAIVDNVKLRDKLVASKDVLIKNVKLITLDHALPDDEWTSRSALVKKDKDLDELSALARRLELKSLMPDNDQRPEGDEPVKREKKPPSGFVTPDLFDNI